MNKSCPRELCERLQEMGCKSESEFYYIKSGEFAGINYMPSFGLKWSDDFLKNKIYLFFQNDFTGATEQVRENARLTMDESDIGWGPKGSASEYHRHAMIDNTEGEWWEFLERSMRK